MRHNGGYGVTTLLDSTLEVRCVQYRREFQMPASIDPTSRRILLHIGARYGAITMPADLGDRVRSLLLGEHLTAPVVDHPRARRWTFITGPGQPDSIGAPASAELFRLYATVACSGSQVVLPSPQDERTGYRIWIEPPAPAAPPPRLARVVDAALELGRARGIGRAVSAKRGAPPR